MKKFLSFFAAMLVAFVANAAVIQISPTSPQPADNLRLALNTAADGDEIVMAAGTYVESNGNYIAFDGKAVTVKAAEGANVIIQPQVPITISNGGHAIFENVKIDAARLTELADWYEHLLYVTDENPNGCTFRGCELYGFKLNKSMFYCNSANKVAAMKFENCYLHDIQKSIIFIENTAGKPMVSVKNCTFENIIATVTDSYWAGIIDVRAAEATLNVDQCTFYNVIPMNTDYSAVSKITLAKGTVSNCIFMLPTAQDNIRAMRGVTATNCITFNYLKDSGTGIHSSVTKNNCVQVDPKFVNAAEGNFTLGEGSPALTMNDGKPIGDPRWIPAGKVLADGFYLIGKTGWDLDDIDSTLLFKVNPANDKEYILHILLAEKDSFKIVKVEDDGIVAWYPDQADNYAVDAKHAGEKDIYFRPDGQGGEGWYHGVIYIAANEPPAKKTFVAKDLADIAATDAVIITITTSDGKTYAMSNNNGTSAAPAAVEVTIANKVIETDSTNILWNIVQDGDSFKIAAGAEKYLYCTSSNNGVRVGTNTNNNFSIKDKYLYHNATARFIGVYNKQDWRCYTSINANIKDEVLVFYAEGEAPAPEVKYYMKNNWDAAADWTWKEMTKDGDNYKLEKVVFGGSGVNYNTAESDEKAVWVELAKFKGDTIAAKDTVTLVLNPADSTITATLLGKYVEPAPEIPTILFKTVATTDTAAGAVYVDNEYINIKTVYKGTIVEHNATVFGEAYTHAIQVRVTDYPSADVPTGTLHANGTPLVITAKKDGIIKLYYVRQSIDKKWEENDNKDVILFDQAAPTEKLKAAEMVEDSVLSDSSYYYIGKVYELKAGKTYTLAAKGTTLKLLGFAYPGEAPEPKHTYTVAGSPSVFGSNWNPADTINDMKEVEKGIYLWAKNDIALAPGNIEFKICEDHAWTKAWPAQNYVIKIDSAGLYTVAIYFTSKNDSISAMAIKTGEAVVIPKVILHGDFTGSWADTKEFTLADDSLSASLKLALGVKNYEFGMKFDGTWKANGAALTRENPSTSLLEGSGNMHINADVAGEYIFTYTFEAQTLAVTYPAKPADGPEAAPAEPTLPANQVKAVYSAKYEADCDFGEWGSGTVYTQETVGKKYVTTDLGYFGLTFDNRHLNCSKMEKLHLDVWIAKDTTFRVVPIWGGAEQGIFVRLEAGKWNAIDIALADFDKVTSWSDVYQIKIDEARNMTFWLNNVYFYTTQAPEEDPEAPKDFTAVLTETSFYSAKIKANATDNSGSVIFDVIYGEMIIASAGGESGKDATITVKNLAANGEYIVKVVAKDESGNKAEPIELTIKTLAAPAPAHAPALDAANVVSLYSDAYTPAAAFEDMNQSWWMGPALIVEDELVEGDNVLFYTDFAEGGAFGWAFKDAVDAAGFQKLHLDIYPTAATSFTVWPVISPEDAFKTTTGELVANQWNEVIIDLSDKTFAPFKQFGWVIAKSIPGFFVDNVYFFKDAEGIDNTDATVKAVKVMENGQILIIKNGKTYNVLGTLVK